MAKQPPASGSSKHKDDDSWGKLASDLLGIQFGGPDDDFDLPDEEAPTAKPVEAAASPAPVATSAVTPTAVQSPLEPDLSFSEDDLSFPEVDDEETAADAREDVQPVSAEETTTHSRKENEPDIWDQLESWNWEEPVKPAPRSHSDASSGRSGDRSGRHGSSGPPRDRDGGRDRSRSRDEDRSRPPREAAAPAVEQTPRDRPPRDEGVPRREERPRRSESREDAPRVEQRPARQPESTKQRPPRSASPHSTASVAPDDSFASGLDDEPKPRRSPPALSRPAESAVVPPVRQPAPTRASDDDEFAMDLFQELAGEADDADITTGPAGESSSEDRPRRRRRRRRGGRGRRPEAVGGETDTGDGSDTDGHDEDEPLAFASDDDLSSGNADDDDEVSVVRSEKDQDEGGEQRRPRRRRRRGSRRPDERPAEVGAVGADQRSESDVEDEDDEPMTRTERIEEEPLAPVNYEGIPTWEEAISYLIRTRGPEPRGRGNSGSRGRGGPPQRR